jgi:hypothetical protein
MNTKATASTVLNALMVEAQGAKHRADDLLFRLRGMVAPIVDAVFGFRGGDVSEMYLDSDEGVPVYKITYSWPDDYRDIKLPCAIWDAADPLEAARLHKEALAAKGKQELIAKKRAEAARLAGEADKLEGGA